MSFFLRSFGAISRKFVKLFTDISFKMHFFLRTLLFLIPFLPFSTGARELPIEVNYTYENIGKKITWFEDKSASLNLSQIKGLEESGRFTAGKQEILNFGNTKSAFWIKLRYRTKDHTPIYLIVDAPNIEHIDLYTFDENGRTRHTKSGCLSYEMTDVVIENNFSFKLPQGTLGKEQILFLRVQTNNILMVPLKISDAGLIMKGRAFKDRIEYIYVGVLMALLIFNLFLFVSLKDITYLYYTLYVLTLSCYLLIYIRGYGFLFGEDWRILFNHHPHVFLSLSVLTSLLFCKKFLNLSQTVPSMLKFYYFLAFCGIVLFFSSILGYKSLSASIAQVLTISLSLIVWISGIIAYRRGHKPAKYYIIAWFFIWVTVGIVTLSLSGLINATEFTIQLVPIGSTIELLLLSFALGNRYKIIIQTEQELRDENLMLVKTQNQRLEQNVKERTLQLSKTIKDLEASDAVKNKLFSIIAHDLRSPLNSLMSILALSEMNALSIQDFQFMLSENKKNIETINNTLNNLLYWAKEQMDGITTKPENFDLKQLLDDLMLVYSPLMYKKKISALVHNEGEIRTYADLNQTKLILRNLIDNAIKFTPESAEIMLKLADEDDGVQILISNTIADSSKINTDNIMNLKVTEATYGTANEKGVGLGLHLCREYVRINGGILKSKIEGDNIIFYFTFPKSKLHLK